MAHPCYECGGECDRETVLRFLELQRRLNGNLNGLIPATSETGQLMLIKKENKLRTGLKEAITEYLKSNPGYHDRRTITLAIIDQFSEVETVESLLPKVSNALTKDRGTENPAFVWQKSKGKQKVWSLKK